ncbi:AAA family ATPase, partial [Pelomonas sp. KK5]|uniref:ATP-binding protein n=1 Tax=Pelomonas sp. KK5 TaxID=1855730 RepID=UPI00097CA428
MHELVERDIPLARLQALRREAAAGQGRVALLAGEAGIGKTSLLLQMLRQPDGQAAGPVWWGGCDALQTPLPLAPLLDVARDAAPAFAALLDGPRPALFDAVLAGLRAAPLLFVVEDAHWADEATLDLLKFLGRRIAGTRALLIVSYRDDELGATHPLRRLLGELPQAERIELAPLTPAGVALLARRALRDPAALHATTQGNPFFVTELLRHGTTELPRSVQDLVLARFARLGAGARQLLGAAALVPGRIERWLLAAVLPDLDALAETLDSGLLRTDGPEALAFRHELARTAIEATLAGPQALHARLLQALAAHGGVAPARLAHHALGADDAAEIRRHVPLAAEAALARGSLREAARHYRAALAHAEPAMLPRWLEAFADLGQRIDAIDEAIAARERLDALLDGQPQGIRALNLSRLAMMYVHMSRNAEADAASARAIALVQQHGGSPSGATAAVYGTEAALRMLNRECEAAVDWARRSLALAGGDRLRQLASLSTLGTALMFLDYDAGCRQMQEVLDLALAEGHAPIAAQALMNLGSAAGELMRYADGMAWLRRGADFAAERELDAAAHYAQAWLALCCLQSGLWDEAGMRAASVVDRPASSAISRLMALLALARLRIRRGDPGAEEALDAATALAAGTLQRIAPVRA